MRASLSSIPSRHGLGLLVLLCCLLLATSTTGPGAWLPQRPRSTMSFLDGGVFAGGGDFSHDYGLDLFWSRLRRSDPVLSLRSGDARLNNDGVGGLVAFLLCSLKGVGGDNLKQGGDGNRSAALLLIGVFCLQYGLFWLAVFGRVRGEAFGPYSEIQLERVIPLGLAIGEGGLPLLVVT